MASLYPESTAFRREHDAPRFGQSFNSVETLKIATSGNCELFAMSGERNLYKEAKLGGLQESARADYQRNLLVIIKDGRLYKNTLPN